MKCEVRVLFPQCGAWTDSFVHPRYLGTPTHGYLSVQVANHILYTICFMTLFQMKIVGILIENLLALNYLNV